jgi:hypothetical protein
MTQALKPAPTIGFYRVAEYAILDGSIPYCGHSDLFKGEKEVGPVPCLAICWVGRGPGVLLLHCNRDWTVRGISERESLGAAKDFAEKIYPGVSSFWTDAHVKEEEAAKHLQDVGSGQCTFCKRTAFDSETARFIEKNGTWICESCVKECYDILQNT